METGPPRRGCRQTCQQSPGMGDATSRAGTAFKSRTYRLVLPVLHLTIPVHLPAPVHLSAPVHRPAVLVWDSRCPICFWDYPPDIWIPCDPGTPGLSGREFGSTRPAYRGIPGICGMVNIATSSVRHITNTETKREVSWDIGHHSRRKPAMATAPLRRRADRAVERGERQGVARARNARPSRGPGPINCPGPARGSNAPDVATWPLGAGRASKSRSPTGNLTYTAVSDLPAALESGGCDQGVLGSVSGAAWRKCRGGCRYRSLRCDFALRDVARPLQMPPCNTAASA